MLSPCKCHRLKGGDTVSPSFLRIYIIVWNEDSIGFHAIQPAEHEDLLDLDGFVVGSHGIWDPNPINPQTYFFFNLNTPEGAFCHNSWRQGEATRSCSQSTWRQTLTPQLHGTCGFPQASSTGIHMLLRWCLQVPLGFRVLVSVSTLGFSMLNSTKIIW